MRGWGVGGRGDLKHHPTKSDGNLYILISKESGFKIDSVRLLSFM